MNFPCESIVTVHCGAALSLNPKLSPLFLLAPPILLSCPALALPPLYFSTASMWKSACALLWHSECALCAGGGMKAAAIVHAMPQHKVAVSTCAAQREAEGGGEAGQGGTSSRHARHRRCTLLEHWCAQLMRPCSSGDLASRASGNITNSAHMDGWYMQCMRRGLGWWCGAVPAR